MVEDGRKEKELEAAVQHQVEPQNRAEELDMIYRDHHKQVFQAAYRVTGNAMDAEDVMQTVFVRLLRRDRGAALSQSPSGYLHRAAVNAPPGVAGPPTQGGPGPEPGRRRGAREFSAPLDHLGRGRGPSQAGEAPRAWPAA